MGCKVFEGFEQASQTVELRIPIAGFQGLYNFHKVFIVGFSWGCKGSKL